MKASYISVTLTSQDIQSFIDDFLKDDFVVKDLKVVCHEGYFLISGEYDIKDNALIISLQFKVEKIQEDVISFHVDLIEPNIADVSFKTAVSFLNKNFSDLTQMGIVDANAMLALNLSKLVSLLPINSLKIDKLNIKEGYFELECENIDISI